MARLPNPRALGRLAHLLGLLGRHYAGYRFNRQRPSPHVAGFLGDAARALGGDVRIEGVPLARDVLFVANHQSWYDIVALGGETGASFVSKAEVGEWPLVGALARMAETILIKREARSATIDQATAIRAKLATGHPVALFAEGTTAGGTEVLPFRASLFAAVVPPPPGVRVQPVAIDYGPAADAIRWGRDESARGNALRLIGRRGRLPVRLRFLEPLDPHAFSGRKALAEAARAAILIALQRGPSAPADDRVIAARGDR